MAYPPAGEMARQNRLNRGCKNGVMRVGGNVGVMKVVNARAAVLTRRHNSLVSDRLADTIAVPARRPSLNVLQRMS
ncbi:MAG TPA: hypothetical protein VFW73_07780 [Lacipirellulaceae bacterium]|nr:hypothetical protein [Lacipirellulaceae bacterium]